ncbi:MAG: hypothetical protein H6578_08190 [Chitinophagales bacterium]|nr:hypothetical protein [Chitinophagales bacterium]
MALRIFSFIILFNFLFINEIKSQQQLFFTDVYNTNIYKNNDNNKIIFNNNLFANLNQNEYNTVTSIIDTYFKEIKVEASKATPIHNYQVIYNYTTTNFKPLQWSKTWHQKYEDTLVSYLNQVHKDYFDTLNIENESNIAYAKLMYLDKIKHNYNSSTFSSTFINIYVQNVNINRFKQENVAPNQTWNRIITNSKLTSYNESYYFKDVKQDAYLYIGPNFKSRLDDCLSMILIKLINNNLNYQYFNNYSFFTLPTKTIATIDSLQFITYKNEAFKILEQHINNQTLSFYSIDDLESLSRLKEFYSYGTFKEFFSIYITNNNFTKLTNNKDERYSYFSIVDTIHYKPNSANFISQKDSTELQEIALLLLNNEYRELTIYGNADKSEYVKIEKSKYKNLVDKYNKYQPMKISRKVDLSLYRALLVFDYLHDKGLAPQKMMCIGRQYKAENLVEIDVKEQAKHAKLYFTLKK